MTQPALISVPGAGNLPSGAAPNIAGAQGVWLRLTLPAGTAAYKGCCRPAGAGDDDVSSPAYRAGKALGAAPAK